MTTSLVAGSGGFIGGHLVKRLLDEGHKVIAADAKILNDWHQYDVRAINQRLNLANQDDVAYAVAETDNVFMLAADMGGMGFIEAHKLDCMLTVIPSTLMLKAAKWHGVKRFFYASSACVYPAYRQNSTNVVALKESDAYPAEAEDGYGWEKLFTERMCRHFYEEADLETRVARYHNVYGPCFDDKTEVLTDKGWKFFDDLTDKDKILSLDPVSGIMKYLSPVAHQKFFYEGPMYSVKSRSVDQVVTPDHKLWVSTKTTRNGKSGWSNFSLQEAKELKWDAARMRFSSYGEWAGLQLTHKVLLATLGSDGRELHDLRVIDAKTWFEFVGWYISEGSSWKTDRNYTVNISQNPGDKHDRIKALIASMGFQCHSNGRNIVVSNKQLYEAVQQFGKGAHGKIIPSDMLGGSLELLTILWNSLMSGDGDEDGQRYTTSSKPLSDAFQELSLKIGKRAWIKSEGEIYRIYLSDRTFMETKRNHRSIVDYAGFVYDVTLPENHILMIRRNGKPSWSGNCGTWQGGREKAPAAVCRKVVEAVVSGNHEIVIWGDGEQTRSFMYVDDCVEGTLKIMNGEYHDPINLGSSDLVSINQLVDIVEDIAGIKLKRTYNLDAPQGVRGRNSDNTLIKSLFDGWEPSIPLRRGMEQTYRWIFDEHAKSRK